MAAEIAAFAATRLPMPLRAAVFSLRSAMIIAPLRGMLPRAARYDFFFATLTRHALLRCVFFAARYDSTYAILFFMRFADSLILPMLLLSLRFFADAGVADASTAPRHA